VAKGRYLGLRLFLEGIECDIVSAVTTAGINRPGTATIDIPACDGAHILHPRTLVHLFYIESGYNIVSTEETIGLPVDPNDPFIDHQALPPDTVVKTKRGDRLLDVHALANWRLLFTGEVLGYSYVKVAGVRHISLHCQDFTSYWQQAKLYWGKASTSSNSYKKTIFTGATHLHVGKRAVTKSNALVSLLMSRPSTIPQLPGVLGGVVNLLESAVGVYDVHAAKRYRGVNDFMTQAELRLKLTRTIGASPDDDTSAQFLNVKSFRRYVRRISSKVKSTSSYLDLAQVFLGKCYHQWTSVAAPPLIPVGTQVASVKTVIPIGVNFGKSAKGKKAKKALDTVKKAHAVVNKEVLADNKRATDIIKGGGSDRDSHRWKGKETGLGTELNVGGAKEFAAAVEDTGIFSIDTAPLEERGDPKRLGGRSKREGALFSAAHDIKNLQKSNSETELKGNTLKDKIQIDSHLKDGIKDPHEIGMSKLDVRELHAKLEKLVKKLSKAGGGSTRTVTTLIPLNSRLHTVLFTPDIYMVPPPTCNVLFPDHYSSIRFNRKWMSEVTRLWLHGRTVSGRDKKDMYFAPNTDILNGPKAKDATDAVKKGISFLMQHERYVGVIPAIEGLGDNDIFKRLHKKTVDTKRKNRKARIKDSEEGRDMAGQAIFSPQEHLQRAANYLFFAKRYESRLMDVTARFSPQIVVGLPCLVLDPLRGQKSRFSVKTEKSIALEKTAGFEATPSDKKSPLPMGTHYIGVVANIRHQLDASGGAISYIQLAKCRAHNEGVDLFAPPDEAGYASIHKMKRRHLSKKTKGVLLVKGFKEDGSVDIGDQGIADVVTEDGAQFKSFKRRRGASYSVSITRFFPDDPEATLMDHPEGGLTQVPGGYGLTLGKIERGSEGKRRLDPFGEGIVNPHKSLSDHGQVTDPSHGVHVDVTEKRTVTVFDFKPKFSFEGTTTPPWFSPIYMPAAIGKEFYQKMIGCGSVLDEGLLSEFGAQEGLGVSPGGEKGFSGMHTIAFETNDGTGVKEVSVPSELIDPANTVKKAAEGLAEFWLGLQEIGADMDLFIDVYTKRKYANILEVLGNTNPDMLVTVRDGVAPNIGAVELEGFHGKAFGRLTQFKGFPEYEPLAMVDGTGKKRFLNPDLDTRMAKYLAVLNYKDEINSLGANNVYGFGTERPQPAGPPIDPNVGFA